MGPMPQPANSQYRPPQLDTNPNVRKDTTVEKRKRAVPTKRFRPSTAPKPSRNSHAPTCQLFSKVQPMSNPKQMLQKIDPPLEDAPDCKSTPRPSTGKISGKPLGGQKLVASSQLLEQ